MSRMPVILIGGGGHAGVVLEVCRAAGVPVVGVVDDDPDCPLARAPDGVGWLGRTDSFVIPDGAGYLIAIGDLAARARVLGLLDAGLASGPVVHPSAVVSPAARLGDGVVVMPGAVVNRAADIGDHAIVNTRTVVEHDCMVGANAHLAPGSVLGGGASVGAGTLIGIQAAVLPGVGVGERCVVGAGAVVTRNVPDGATVVGVPARSVGVGV
ncbi:MAG: NeuD/PglB/VioB family sugar acetyltransferase [Phycisphaerales bacterium]|nr:NeuD/PglB/VioB family sugar acetyltransferase [Planctomycetota bacterium]MCH8509945.1 NeuD/PglB/VioB family sugar acetyltransferase [Phycisphaerales bacterium]